MNHEAVVVGSLGASAAAAAAVQTIIMNGGAAAAAGALHQQQQQQHHHQQHQQHQQAPPPSLLNIAQDFPPPPPDPSPQAAPLTTSPTSAAAPSRYESQKRRDWNTFGQYLRNHRPPLALARCSGAHVLEFLRYLDQFGKTKVHAQGCPFFGHPHPPAPCGCPLRQAWGSLDALIGRLRAAFEEHGGKPESNPFGARAVRLYLREVRETQAKARGIAHEKKKRKRAPQAAASTAPTTAPALPSSDHQQSVAGPGSLLIPSCN